MPEAAEHPPLLLVEGRKKAVVRQQRAASLAGGPLQPAEPFEHKLPTLRRELLPGAEHTLGLLPLSGAHLPEEASPPANLILLRRWQIGKALQPLKRPIPLRRRLAIESFQAPVKFLLRLRRQGLERLALFERPALLPGRERRHPQEQVLRRLPCPAPLPLLEQPASPFGRQGIELLQPPPELLLRARRQLLKTLVVFQCPPLLSRWQTRHALEEFPHRAVLATPASLSRTRSLPLLMLLRPRSLSALLRARTLGALSLLVPLWPPPGLLRGTIGRQQGQAQPGHREQEPLASLRPHSSSSSSDRGSKSASNFSSSS